MFQYGLVGAFVVLFVAFVAAEEAEQWIAEYNEAMSEVGRVAP